MGLNDMFDDSKAESGAAEIARSRLIDTVEALCQARQIFFRNAHAGVAD